MASPNNQRRQIALLVILVIIAAVVLYSQFGGEATGAGRVASNPQATVLGSGAGPAVGGLPEPLKLAALDPVPVETSGARNPFGFGVPPRPPAPPPAAPPPSPAPTPAAPTGPPPRPAIPVKFLGFAEDPARPGKVVSLAVGGAVVLAREGDVVDGRYRLLKVGLESIVMVYLDGQGQQTIRQTGG